MDTSVSQVLKQTGCIYLEVDENALIESLLAEAKSIATREDKMVIFTPGSSGRLLQVTSKSNIEDMVRAWRDRYNCALIIK